MGAPTAECLTWGGARGAWGAEALPGPPQPTRPILSTSLPAAWTAGARLRPAAAAPVTAAAEVRKSRRVAPLAVEAGCVTVASPGGRNRVGAAVRTSP